MEKTYLIVLCNDYGLIKELDICGCSHKNGVKKLMVILWIFVVKHLLLSWVLM